MKKIISVLAFALLAGSLFAAGYSYKNNTYQKLADEYTKKAEAALEGICSPVAHRAQLHERTRTGDARDYR